MHFHFNNIYSSRDNYYIIIVSMLSARTQTDPSRDRNPISRINRGFRKGRFYHPPATPDPPVPHLPTTTLPLRFSSLSRNKENYPLSDNRPTRQHHLQLME